VVGAKVAIAPWSNGFALPSMARKAMSRGERWSVIDVPGKQVRVSNAFL
jgi:hypothetical protein